MRAFDTLAGCRCVACAGSNLEWDGGTVTQMVRCSSCGTAYDVIDGIPYLLVVEERDFVALVEIAGEFDSPYYAPQRASPFDGSWAPVLAQYDAATEKELFRAGLDASKAAQIVDRHEQWRELQILSGNLDLTGKNVLVVGAGLGFDAHLIIQRGARVTAVDLNPQTNSFGRIQTPQARWIGALGRRLPFVDGYFDHVFISASLHHVLDVSASIVEMLRVLRPAGCLITTNDSYMADTVTEAEDARFWNDHTAVLRGINENRPRLMTFIDPLLERRHLLDVEFWTSRAFGVSSRSLLSHRNFPNPTRWDLWQSHPALRTSGGGLFMRVTPKTQVRSSFVPPTKAIVRPSDLARRIGDKTRAMAEIARLAPPAYRSPPFPGSPGNTKFQVLNGWRWTEPGETGREAYLCGRWYLVRNQGQDRLEIEVSAKAITGAADPTLEIVLDGKVEVCTQLPRGKVLAFCVVVAEPVPGTPFCVEVRTQEKDCPIEQGLLRVQRLQFA